MGMKNKKNSSLLPVLLRISLLTLNLTLPLLLFPPLLSWSALANIEVAITIDDLPEHSPLPPMVTRLGIAQKMLSTLKRFAVPEVYGFINAATLNSKPHLAALLKLWHDFGHPLGNHTFSHASLNEVSVADFEKEITQNEAALKKYNGKSPFPWKVFRYPYLREGEELTKRNAIRNFLKQHDYQIAQVTIDFEDWSWNPPYARCLAKHDQVSIKWLRETYLKNAVDQLLRADKMAKALFHRPIKHILLLHIGAFDAEMLTPLLKAYQANGVKFIGLNEAMKDEVYAIDPGLASKRGSELTYQVMQSKKLKLQDLGLTAYLDYPEQKLEKLCL
jgi:peptidoglycan/xylan/chitin deacetylase (PgdA/CDA1 family)